MISNNQILSSQKFNNNIIINRRSRLKRYISQPNQLRQHRLNLKLKQSQDNLFNFINDPTL